MVLGQPSLRALAACSFLFSAVQVSTTAYMVTYLNESLGMTLLAAGASAFVGKDSPTATVVSAARQASVAPLTFTCTGLAEAMLRRGWRVQLSTDERGARYAGGFPDQVAIDTVQSATFARGSRLDKLRVPLHIGRGILDAVLAMRRDRPAVVVGFGGYPSIPALAAATLLRLRAARSLWMIRQAATGR